MQTTSQTIEDSISAGALRRCIEKQEGAALAALRARSAMQAADRFAAQHQNFSAYVAMEARVRLVHIIGAA